MWTKLFTHITDLHQNSKVQEPESLYLLYFFMIIFNYRIIQYTPINFLMPCFTKKKKQAKLFNEKHLVSILCYFLRLLRSGQQKER